MTKNIKYFELVNWPCLVMVLRILVLKVLSETSDTLWAELHIDFYESSFSGELRWLKKFINRFKIQLKRDEEKKRIQEAHVVLTRKINELKLNCDEYLEPLSPRPCSQTIVAWCLPFGFTTYVLPNSSCLLVVLLPEIRRINQALKYQKAFCLLPDPSLFFLNLHVSLTVSYQ